MVRAWVVLGSVLALALVGCAGGEEVVGESSDAVRFARTPPPPPGGGCRCVCVESTNRGSCQTGSTFAGQKNGNNTCNYSTTTTTCASGQQTCADTDADLDNLYPKCGGGPKLPKDFEEARSAE